MSNEKQQHTPEPWRLGNDLETVYDTNNFSIASIDTAYGILEDWVKTGARHWSEKPGVTNRDISEEEGEANTKRIIECVNALAGIENPGHARAMWETMEQENIAMRERIASLTEQVEQMKGLVDVGKELAEWSRKYPRERIYGMSQINMDDELIVLEQKAKCAFPIQTKDSNNQKGE